MKRAGRNIIIILSSLAVLLFGLYFAILTYEKSKSPEETIVYKEDGLDIEITYHRPSMKGRKIFGKLVPYGEVWRTGANEPVSFTTRSQIKMNGKSLRPGTYTLWTIPDESAWEIIINDQEYAWGINTDGKAAREPVYDVLNVRSTPQELVFPVDTFTMTLDDNILSMMWERTKVEVVLSR